MPQSQTQRDRSSKLFGTMHDLEVRFLERLRGALGKAEAVVDRRLSRRRHSPTASEGQPKVTKAPIDHPRPTSEKQPQPRMAEAPVDEVDEASEESFPASDPPSFTGMSAR